MSGEKDWSTGLFGCLDDAGLCVWGLFCTACLFGENVSSLTQVQSQQDLINKVPPPVASGCCCPCLLYSLTTVYCWCCVGGLNRRDLREKYGLRHEPCGDCTVHMFCSPCAVCQEARELKVRLAAA
ncbi:hypothetical protein BSKO_01053 [Bryopsis sp. KO-2023]|nr:hypothetical protein BSKO_01053 [Bryopsis sp. KO-2023]